MDSHDLTPRSSHPMLRRLLLLVPLTWPGFVYGLWQRRWDLWVSLPWPPLGQWWQQVATHRAFVPSLVVMGSVVLVSAGIYGAVVYGGPLITALFQPSMSRLAQPELPAWPVETPGSAVEGIKDLGPVVFGMLRWTAPMGFALAGVISLLAGNVSMAAGLMAVAGAWSVLPALLGSLQHSAGIGLLGAP